LANPKIGVIGIPGKWSTETLADEVEAKTGFRLIIDMNHVTLNLNDATLHFGDTNLCELDGLIIKKISSRYNPNTLDRLELLRIAEAAGVAIFGKPERILRLIDRLSCTVSLRNGNIPMPPTTITEDLDEACAAVHRYKSAIFKPLYSTKARGMKVMESLWGDLRLREAVKHYQQEHQMLYIQQRLNLSGKDMGLVFLNGEYRCAYARVAETGSWNTTINSGGHYEAHTPSDEIIEMAQKAQSLFGLDFTTVDVAESDQGAIVFEVSAFGGFRGALEGCGFNAAAAYTSHVLKQLDN
jgi:tetrahydromethanopterin:alpha-L-glutamate ligase